MKIFKNKNLIQKLVIAIVCVTLFNFCVMPIKVEALGEHTIGGSLFDLLKDFATFISDITVSLIQSGFIGEWIDAVDKSDSGFFNPKSGVNNSYFEEEIKYPIIQISPELIFANKIQMLDVNFIGQKTDSEIEEPYIKAKDESAVATLRTIIASWYVTLRTVAIVGLLSVLIYIGIRIIISSTSQDKAKYKQRLMDWVVAFCLLFFMHYIMAATVNIVSQVNEMLSDIANVGTGIKLDSKKGNIIYLPLDPIEHEEQVADVFREDPEGLKNYVKVKYKGKWYTITELKEGIDGENGKEDIDEDAKTVIKINDDRSGRSEEGIALWTYTVTPHPSYADKEENGELIIGSDVLVITLEISQINGYDWITKGTIKYYNKDEDEITNSKVYDTSKLQDYLDNLKIDIVNSETVENNNSKVNIKHVESMNGKDIIVLKDSLTSDLSNPKQEDGSRILYFINYARLYLNNNSAAENVPQAAGYLIIYIALVVFTCMFAIRYIKRVIYIAFLTLMAPLVALTYPLDKLKDRKSTSI